MGTKIWTAAVLATIVAMPAGFAVAQEGAMDTATDATRDTADRAEAAGDRVMQREQAEDRMTGQDPTAVLPGKAMEAQNQGRLIRVEEWIGQDVKNQAGEDLGEVRDFAVEPQQGRVQYFVIAAGGKLHALPIRAFQPSVQDALIVNAQPEDFENAQGFDDDAAWPTQADQNLARQLGLMDRPGQSTQQRAQGQAGELRQQAQEQAGEMAQQAGAGEAAEMSGMGDATWHRRASSLTGAAVRANDDEVGEVSDLVVDTQTGRIVYAIVDANDAHSLVPWQALAVDRQNQSLTLSGDPAALQQTAFEGEQLPDLTDPQHMERTYQAFGLDANPEVYGFAQPTDQAGQGGQTQNQQQQQPQGQRQPSQQSQDAQQDNQGMGGMGQ